MESYSPLVRSKGIVVLAPEALVEENSAIIHLDWKIDAKNPSGLSQDLLNVRVQFHYVGSFLELFQRHIVLGLLHPHANWGGVVLCCSLQQQTSLLNRTRHREILHLDLSSLTTENV